MDLKKIFLKEACPTSVGGQAVMEGIMMRSTNRLAVAVRLPDGRIQMKTKPLKAASKWSKVPVVRGVIAFVSSLVEGTKILMYSAEVIEQTLDQEEEPTKFEKWLERKFGAKGMWNILIYTSVALAIMLSVGLFILLPTVLISWLGYFIKSYFILNLIEGIIRIIIFIIYITAISKMKDIQKVFQYHGAEHKCIHCFENGMELTPENAKSYYTLHPRCGTSFLMFVMVISLILFSLLGWPNIWIRLVSRIVLIPVVAGLSYELLKFAGRSNGKIVKFLSLPGLYLQKLTTREPDEEQLEVAIAAMKAVLVNEDAPYFEGICDKDGNLIEENVINKNEKREQE